MAIKAYVLIETEVGKTREVAQSLIGRPGITTIDPVTGPYDIIAVVEGQDLSEVGQLVTSNIHTIGGINRTTTCLAIQL